MDAIVPRTPLFQAFTLNTSKKDNFLLVVMFLIFFT
jgi:hypothetical protein